MKVKDLKRILAEMPDDLDVMISQHNDEFELSLLESAETKMCTFSDGELKAKALCCVLTDK